MQISKLYNLLVVAESQSISTAAQKLFISQSSLSSMIKSVEEELGVTIFRRTAKGVLPPRRGRCFCALHGMSPTNTTS